MSRLSRLSLKFLVSNSLAGTLIGTGGSAIRELMETTNTRVSVSSIQDVYPGTQERIVLVTGEPQDVNKAQELIWDLIGVSTASNGDKSVPWSPRAAQSEPRSFDGISVSGKITISAAAGGLILGKGGATFRAIAEESGAHTIMNSKEDALFTHERIVSVSGSLNQCRLCISLIIDKLSEDLEAAQYVNRGLTYTAHLTAAAGAGSHIRGRRSAATDNQTTAGTADTLSTTITINVADALIGNILGKKGATMREIMSLSGAKIVVSARGESNRIVTITGAPANAQAAHMLVTQKLNQSSSRSRRSDENA